MCIREDGLINKFGEKKTHKKKHCLLFCVAEMVKCQNNLDRSAQHVIINNMYLFSFKQCP